MTKGSLMAEETSGKSKVMMIVHLILYTLLIGSLSAVVYLDFDHIEKEVNKLIDGQVMSRSYESEDIQKMLDAENEELQESYLKLENDLNQTQLAFKTLQQEKALLDRQLKNVSSKKDQVTSKATMVKSSTHCYDMYQGSYHIPKQCRKNILRYVNKHKDAKYFEIIGIVDSAEFKLYDKLEKNNFLYEKLGVSERSIRNLKKFTQEGLAKHRAMEASWVIKMHTKKEAVTYNVHYHLLSKKGQKGFIIRAYK